MAISACDNRSVAKLVALAKTKIPSVTSRIAGSRTFLTPS